MQAGHAQTVVVYLVSNVTDVDPKQVRIGIPVQQ